MLGWLLTTNGRAVRVETTNMRESIETGLLSDLIGFTTIAPGVDLWRDLTACSTGKPLNAAAIGFVDELVNETVATLPRVHGNCFIASHDEFGEPDGIGARGWVELINTFPHLQEPCGS